MRSGVGGEQVRTTRYHAVLLFVTMLPVVLLAKCVRCCCCRLTILSSTILSCLALTGVS